MNIPVLAACYLYMYVKIALRLPEIGLYALKVTLCNL